MSKRRHSECMEILAILTILLLAGVYSVVAPDHRDYDDRDRQGWWSGRP